MGQVHPFKLARGINGFITDTFGSDKLPGSVSAQQKLVTYIVNFLQDNEVIPVCNPLGTYVKYVDITITSPDHPHRARIKTVTKNVTDVSSFNSDHEIELTSVLEEVPNGVYICTPVKETTIPKSFPDAKILTPQVRQDTTESKEPVVEVKESVKPEEIKPVEVVREEMQNKTTEVPDLREVTNSIKKVVNFGAFANALNLFNIGNIQLGSSVTMSQIGNINGAIYDIMKNYNTFKDDIPGSICRISGVFDYENNIFMLDVDVCVDMRIQKIESRYTVKFYISSK